MAHSCGQPATLRVLSYTAPTFEELCQPTSLSTEMTESSITVKWTQCPLQKIPSIKQLEIQKYVVTIFPSSRRHMREVDFDAQLEVEILHKLHFKGF